MTTLWDTFGLFQELLENGPNLCRPIDFRNPATDPVELALRAARIGFELQTPSAAWCPEHEEFVRNKIENDFDAETVAWFEDAADAIRIFSSLAIGAMLGKYQNEEIDDAGLFLGNAHLAGFNMQNIELIKNCFSHR